MPFRISGEVPTIQNPLHRRFRIFHAGEKPRRLSRGSCRCGGARERGQVRGQGVEDEEGLGERDTSAKSHRLGAVVESKRAIGGDAKLLDLRQVVGPAASAAEDRALEGECGGRDGDDFTATCVEPEAADGPEDGRPNFDRSAADSLVRGEYGFVFNKACFSVVGKWQ